MKRDFLFTVISFAFGKGGFLIVSALAANLLAVKEYAYYALIFTVINLVSGTIGLAGFTTSNRYYDKKNRQGLTKYFYGFALITALSTYITSNLFLDEHFDSVSILVLSLCAFLCVVYNYNFGCLYSASKNKAAALINFLLFLILLAFSLAASKYGVNWILYGYFCVFLFGVIISSFLLYSKDNVKIDNLAGTAIKKVTIPQLLTSLAFLPLISILSIMLLDVDESGQELVIFNVSNQVRMLISFFPMIFSALLLSKLTRNEVTFEFDWKANAALTSLLGFILFLTLPVIIYIFNLEFNQYNTNVLAFMISSGIVAALKSPISRQLIVREQGITSLFSNLAFGVLFFIFVFIFSRKELNALTISFSFFIAQVLHFLIFYKYFIGLEVLKPAMIKNKHFVYSCLSLLVSLSIIIMNKALFWIVFLVALLYLVILFKVLRVGK
ncbi:hypothetical protein L6J37_02370 [Photobacterium sp. WH77]|uniref:hypothetical protein n=1 Tax=unclassified Photobacterium TaxID=2628852 RepID=UPI001EDB5B42|nr:MULTISPECIES: hypothetical protein [unclassified Photobacterium]MCG2835704.1 hypothetical protein [Photobacterium sp. WH77]MCG2843317.1 hypothetical protein [Photobacterium sp. WH80]